MMRCQVCLRDTDIIKEYKGDSLCPDCYDSMAVFDEEFEKSGLTRDQFFKRKLLDFVEKRYSKFARGN